MKSVFAILVGYVVFGASTILLFRVASVNPRQERELEFRIWSTLYGVFFAPTGGYVAARIAGRSEIAHATALACILAVIATVSLITQPGHGSPWSHIAALGFMAPAGILGRVVRARQVRIKA